MGAKVIYLKKNFWLILIFLLALFFRFYKLDVYPEAIDEDEMSLGYISYSLLKNGTDEYGNKFPIYFQSVGDYKYGLYSYFSIVPISILGLNEFSTRFTSALFGSMSVILIYFLAGEVFKSKKISLISAIFLATVPLHIHYSRVAYSNIFGSFWVLLFIFMYLKLIKKFNFKLMFFGLISILLATYSYQAYRVLIPVLLISTPFLYYDSFKKEIIRKLVFPILGLVIVAVSFVNPQSRIRSSTTSALIDTPSLVENYSEDNIAGVDLITTRIVHNKLTVFTFDFIKRYMSYFDPRFLFLDSYTYNQRHGTSLIGLIMLSQLPLFLIGFIKLRSYFPYLLLLVSPLAASLVVDSVSPTRSIFLIYPMILISGYGLYYFSEQFPKWRKLIYYVIGFGLLINFVFFIHQYTVHKIYHHPWYSDFGLKEMVLAVNKHIGNYKKIVVSRGHYISFLFYNKSIDDKLIFNMPYDCPAIGQRNVLYVCFTYKVPKAGRLIEVIRFRDNQPAIILVDFNDMQKGNLPDKVSWGDDIPPYKLDEKDYWPNNNYR